MMSEDELISAYVDGQLPSLERAAFEARLSADAGLQHHLRLTQRVVQSARQMSALPVPRHFALPDRYATSRRGWVVWFDWRLIFRAASLISAAMCVLLFAVDLSQRMPALPRSLPIPTALLPVGAPLPNALNPTQANSAVLPPQATRLAVPAHVSNATLIANGVPIAPLPALTDASAPRQQRGAASIRPKTFALPEATLTRPTLPALAQTPAPPAASAIVQPDLQTSLQSVTTTPSPVVEATVVPQSAPPLLSLPSGLALIAFLAALIFGGLGWLKR